MDKTIILNCPVYAGFDVFEHVMPFFGENCLSTDQLFILVDENSKKYCLNKMLGKTAAFDKATIIEIKSGEANKTIDTAVFVWKKLLDFGADRNAIHINLGGGVICDMGGFIASLYKRGIRFINIPTTFMSQVDAGFGGKTGVDMDGLKNQIGLFVNPEAVFVYPGFVETLSKRQKLSGFSEVIKYSVISDGISPDSLAGFDFENEVELEKLIIESIKIKSKIVSEDFKEEGSRKVLNFGHTIGHAMETLSLLNDSEPLLHGEALAAGMICELFLSVNKLGFPPEIQQKINHLIINKYGKYNLERFSFDSLLKLMLNDKKNQNGQIGFVLMEAGGKPLINQSCNTDEVVATLDYYQKLNT
jgi:3-dehydroquinate synthase